MILKPGDLGDVGDVPGGFSLIDFSGLSVLRSVGRESWGLVREFAGPASWIVEAVVVGKKRDATSTRLLNELIVLAIITY